MELVDPWADGVCVRGAGWAGAPLQAAWDVKGSREGSGMLRARGSREGRRGMLRARVKEGGKGSLLGAYSGAVLGAGDDEGYYW
eukprot:1178945-Prorocentrum_minimum.AAC.5